MTGYCAARCILCELLLNKSATDQNKVQFKLIAGPKTCLAPVRRQMMR